MQLLSGSSCQLAGLQISSILSFPYYSIKYLPVVCIYILCINVIVDVRTPLQDTGKERKKSKNMMGALFSTMALALQMIRKSFPFKTLIHKQFK